MYGEMLREVRHAVTQKFLWVVLTTPADQQLSQRWSRAEAEDMPDLGTGVAGAGGVPTACLVNLDWSRIRSAGWENFQKVCSRS